MRYWIFVVFFATAVFMPTLDAQDRYLRPQKQVEIRYEPDPYASMPDAEKVRGDAEAYK